MDSKGCTTLFVVALVITVIGVVIGGWALSVTWAWFIVPVFGLPPISIVEACGIALVVRSMTRDDYKKEEINGISDALSKGLANAVVSPLITLAFGFVIKLFL